ncbi:MscS Mechanosensitive ion channel [Rhodothermus marinus DSM 4252]|uniref:MscS Mechanosensitive ion channel n=2 Tax=Rhodothermus marinus TaxID=29549 RepID=D0MCT9_RHOM4|nr:MscS Mechanosensitive ion channel [Rhodothermus marinus DSM 4252]
MVLGWLLAWLVLGCGQEKPALPVSESVTEVSADTQHSVLVQLDSLQVARLEAALDSLSWEVGRLRQMLEQAGVSEATSAALADTVRAITRQQLADTARQVGYLGLRVVWATFVLVLTYFLVRWSVWLLDMMAERRAARRLFFKRLIPVVRLLLWMGAIYYVMGGIFGVDREGLLAASAVLGVAVGFAAQDVLKNIFGGILIIFDQPFQVGDKVRIGGTYGEVVSIGLRSTRIVTPDDNLVSVPNAQVVEGQVANANAGALDCQVVVDLYLPGWVDVMKAKQIAYQAAASSQYVYLKKPIVVNVRDEFHDMFLLHLIVKAYVLDTRYEFAFASEVTEIAKTEFLRQGLLTPMTTRIPWALEGDLHNPSRAPHES